MIKVSDAYREAVTGTTRRTKIRAVVKAVDPDLEFGASASSDESTVSNLEQVHNDVETPINIATLEPDRWALDGTFEAYDPDAEQEVGFVGELLSDDDGTFSKNQYVEVSLSGVEVLRTITVFFGQAESDGFPVDLLIRVKKGGKWVSDTAITDNGRQTVVVSGLEVFNPEAIRVRVNKWSCPARHVRVVEILPGAYEEWNEDSIINATIQHRGDPSCLTLPYGTLDLSVENLDRRFAPNEPNEIFDSVTGRQRVDVSVGLEIDGEYHWTRNGTYYQNGNSWKLENGGLTMSWSLVDVMGLLSNRHFIHSGTLPTTVGGWVQAIAGQLGGDIARRFTVDHEYIDKPLTIPSGGELENIKCGDLLRYVCMASGLWPRADMQTGFIAVEPLWNQGNAYSADNMEKYPTVSDNPEIGTFNIQVNDGSTGKFSFDGLEDGSKSVTINSPFVGTTEEAIELGRNLLKWGGGSKLAVTGRGNPSSEVGDLCAVETEFSKLVTARMVEQKLSFKKGVLAGCSAEYTSEGSGFVIADGVLFTAPTTWIVPDDVTRVNVVLIGGGQGGERGTRGTYKAAGKKGADGKGGLVWRGTVDVYPGQSVSVVIGAGGQNGVVGGVSKFGNYSSVNGSTYSPYYVDIGSGKAFTLSAQAKTRPNMGDGGKGGDGGQKGTHDYTYHDMTVPKIDPETGVGSMVDVVETIDNGTPPGAGKPGVTGSSGCVIVYFVREGEG